MTEDELDRRFHKHLDGCSQCRNNPFGLCPVGARLLTQLPGTVPELMGRTLIAREEARHD